MGASSYYDGAQIYCELICNSHDILYDIFVFTNIDIVYLQLHNP